VGKQQLKLNWMTAIGRRTRGGWSILVIPMHHCYVVTVAALRESIANEGSGSYCMRCLHISDLVLVACRAITSSVSFSPDFFNGCNVCGARLRIARTLAALSVSYEDESPRNVLAVCGHQSDSIIWIELRA
jgi:hypothetical protein